MEKMVKLAVILFVIAGVAGLYVPVRGYSQEMTEQKKTVPVSGEVVSVDTTNSSLVVKSLKDATTNTYEDVTLSVSTDTKIAKGDAVLMLSDIKAGDKVTAQKEEGSPKVISIAVVAMAETTPAAPAAAPAQ